MGLPDGVTVKGPSLRDPRLAEIFDPFRPRTSIKILVVVDGRLDLDEVEGGMGFGVGRVIRLLRESKDTCNRFEIDTARREPKANVPSTTQGVPTFYGFKFDQIVSSPVNPAEPVLNKYDEVWCFGYNPGNTGGGDEEIDYESNYPLSPNEIHAITEWMNMRQGGLLAMGDHDFLGASLCSKIPRIRSMRRWRNDQNVPPFGQPGDPDAPIRHDTHQPSNDNQRNGTELISELAEVDETPQNIELVSWLSEFILTSVLSKPHPILCHPLFGPINVLPDHNHEGWPYDNKEIDLTAPLNVVGMAGDEYPTVGGIRPEPRVIAYGRTTPDPPHQLYKGDCVAKRYPMISVYDGRPIGLGRVATDATWHHWFDMNLAGIEAAGGANWEKIKRYYLNVALWLAPSAPIRLCWGLDIIASHFIYPGIEEYSPKASLFSLGRSFRPLMLRTWGPCWVSSWVLEQIRTVDDTLWGWIRKHVESGSSNSDHSLPCLACPPLELIETIILGGMVRAAFNIARSLGTRGGREPEKADLSEEMIESFIYEGVKTGLAEYRDLIGKASDEYSSLI
jgi:hypothetical protein